MQVGDVITFTWAEKEVLRGLIKEVREKSLAAEKALNEKEPGLCAYLLVEADRLKEMAWNFMEEHYPDLKQYSIVLDTENITVTITEELDGNEVNK